METKQDEVRNLQDNTFKDVCARSSRKAHRGQERVGTYRRDALSALSPSRIASGKLYTWFNVQFSGKANSICYSVQTNSAHR